MRHLRSVTLGILAYRFAHGGFPPQAVHDRDGKPLYSWRVLILPYIDEQQLFEAFHKDEPWDSPHNRELLASRPLSFDSPLEPNLDPTLTHYQVFVGPGAAFEGAKGLGEHDFRDPLDDTILVTEGRVPVPWSSPSDLPFDEALPIPALGVTTDPDKFVAGFADGDVRLLSRTGLGESGLRARITRSGGETLVPPSNCGRPTGEDQPLPPLVGFGYTQGIALQKAMRSPRRAPEPTAGRIPQRWMVAMPRRTAPWIGIAGVSRIFQTALVAAVSLGSTTQAEEKKLDFNRDVRPILSDKCFTCHGPDAKNRKGPGKGLRLDVQEGATTDLGGYAAIQPGKPEASEAITRIGSDDPNEVMPPPSTGKKLTAKEIQTLKTWISQGAPFSKHWAYIKPVRSVPPEVKKPGWVKSPIDRFVLARLEREGLAPSPEADRLTLIRRVTLDLTGLPPTVEEADRFAADKSPDAYEKLVSRLLDSPAYGEHWARIWLDLARYADSAGYADDPPRTIWAYRDYVVRAITQNKPFDQFTIEQLAGDLLPNPTDDQLIATAFHRNTLTNNEGGTNDEEFRNVAVVDRVNTTMAVWMGTTAACAQCHDHKYDPISQQEYFKLFAFFNNTEDADRRDESPLLSLFSAEQKANKAAWTAEIAKLEAGMKSPAPSVLVGLANWEKKFAKEPVWSGIKPNSIATKSGAKAETKTDGIIAVESKSATDTYTLNYKIDRKAKISALRLETVPDAALPGNGAGYGAGNFVVSRLKAVVRAPGEDTPKGRYVRIEIPGKGKILSLAEVQVFRGGTNIAPQGEAKQSSTDFDGPAKLAIDGKTDGRFEEAKSTTHTKISDDPWWEVDLKSNGPVERIMIWNRTDNGTGTRLADFRVTVLDEGRKPIFERTVAKPPRPSLALALKSGREITFTTASADYSQAGFDASSVLDNKEPTEKGWAVAGSIDKPHQLTLTAAAPLEIEAGSTLQIEIEQLSKFEKHTLGRFRLASTDDPLVADFAKLPAGVLATLKTPAARRSESQKAELNAYYLAEAAPEFIEARKKIASLKKQLSDMKPETTVPIFRDLAGSARRKTKIQVRGDFLNQTDEVSEGVPAVFPPLPKGSVPNRLALAKWLVDPENPLTPRVIANRYWEQIFGIGLVSTSEEFGAQGELPSHPELLDWLAVELVAKKWDMKQFLRELVTSATYRQDGKVSAEAAQRDPENRLLARGPRFRMSAETIRDQALAVAGLLSDKRGGPPVKPPQPSSGLNAAFGSMIDWETSKGEDKYRRAVYTMWRRSNPYPSMTAFDAPNREVCTLKRVRTNTPLQALVTLNDPVFIEAAQALARKTAKLGKTDEDKVKALFRLCLIRNPKPEETARLVQLQRTSRETFAKHQDEARKMATDPIGPIPTGADVSDLAAWTVVGNVLLNLDETVMKR